VSLIYEFNLGYTSAELALPLSYAALRQSMLDEHATGSDQKNQPIIYCKKQLFAIANDSHVREFVAMAANLPREQLGLRALRFWSSDKIEKYKEARAVALAQ
jgi:hypothetical protein